MSAYAELEAALDALAVVQSEAQQGEWSGQIERERLAWLEREYQRLNLEVDALRSRIRREEEEA